MSAAKPVILYVEDDPSLAYITIYNLEERGFEVIHSPDGSEALDLFSSRAFSLCILDVMLPGMDGFELADNIREKNAHIPILFLTVKSLLEDKIRGLKIGADDYLTKPFHMEELILKMQVFLKRNLIHPVEESSFSIGKFIFEWKNLLLCNEQDRYHLTLKEASLLKFLFERKNEVVRREAILKSLWGDDDYFLGRSLDVFISRLRKYFSADEHIRFENVHGVGFRMSVERQSERPVKGQRECERGSERSG